MAQSSGLCTEPITNQHPCYVPGQAQSLTQDVPLLILVGPGVAERHLLGRVEHLNLAV